MAANINVPPVAPVVPVTLNASNLNALASQGIANAFAANVAAQNTSMLVGEGTNTVAPASVSPATLQGDNGVLNESLTSLSPQALIALNATENSTASGTIKTNLTPTQLQEMEILQNDIAQIAAAEEVVPSVTVAENGANVNLSIAAVTTLNDIAAVNNISSTNALTVAQIQEAAMVIAPFINQPLTPQVIAQMQSALVTAGFNPEQLSLQNLLLSMNFVIAESIEANSPDTVAMNEMVAEMETTGEQSS